MSVAATVVLLVASGCVATVTVLVTSVHGSLRAAQSSLDQGASELEQLRKSQRDMDDELHRLRREVSNSSTAGARHDEAMGRHEDSARRSSGILRDATARLEEMRATVESYGPPVAMLSQRQGDLGGVQEAMEAKMKEVQGALEDVRSGVSQERAWHDQVQAWRGQQQKFELETREALQKLRGAQSTRQDGEPGTPLTAGVLASTGEDWATPRSSANQVAAPAQSLVTPRRDATTHHTTEAARVAQLAAPPAGLQISWYRECGCTGMEVEAVTLLEALARSLGAQQVRTNICKKTCTWPDSTRQVLDQIELRGEEGHLSYWLFADRPPGPVVFVVHAAFLGVCGFPQFVLSPSPAEDDSLVQAVSRGRPGLLRVSRSMLENDRLDALDVRRCNGQFDAVWVPSKFNLQTFSRSGVDEKLLQMLPEAVDPRRFNCSAGSPPARSRAPPPLFGAKRLDRFVAAGGGPDTFTFLSVFKWEERKNWNTLLRTFWRIFPRRSTQVVQEDGQTVDVNVRLLIKTQSLDWGTAPDEDIARLTDALGVDVEEAEFRMLMTRKPLPASLLPSLYRAADAFVLPSHGEGWGLPLMEAMASGLPTIGTGWGGNTEFMHAGNSVLLDYQLVDAPHGDSDGSDRPKWADPDHTALAQAMRDAVRRPASLRSLAETACREVGERYTPDAVVHRLVTELAQAAVAAVT